MDVPISVGVLLASGMSLFETARGGPHVYFDSVSMLLFFLLVGRYLDRRARGHARAAAERLLALGTRAVTVLEADGRQRAVPAGMVAPGMIALVAAGERIGVDGTVLDGTSGLDTSLITGETVPATVGPGDRVFAGTLNLDAPLQLAIAAVGEATLLAEIVRLMELAEQRRARYVVLADRLAGLYAPAVHGLALATFLGWTLFAGTAWQAALLYAVAVLIITCPCALGLAVPAVQVIASGRLLSRGVLLKSATALERLAQVDTVVFDKTGTLTRGRPALARSEALDPEALRMAASLAGASRHPLARAMASAVPEAAMARGSRGGARAWSPPCHPDGRDAAGQPGLVRHRRHRHVGVSAGALAGAAGVPARALCLRRSAARRCRSGDPGSARPRAGRRAALGRSRAGSGRGRGGTRHRELARRLHARPTRPPASRRWRRPDVAC